MFESRCSTCPLGDRPEACEAQTLGNLRLCVLAAEQPAYAELLLRRAGFVPAIAEPTLDPPADVQVDVHVSPTATLIEPIWIGRVARCPHRSPIAGEERRG